MQKTINYYRILNVKISAKDKEIREAFLELAQKYHPDKNKGNKLAEKKFKQINEAYQFLKDSIKRKKLDMALEKQVAIDKGRQDFVAKRDVSSSSFLKRPDKTVNKKIIEKKLDIVIPFQISLEDLCQNRSKQLIYSQPFLQGKRKASLSVQIPTGAIAGTRLLFKKQGGASGEKEFGDLYIELNLKPHPLFRLKKQDVHLNLPITFGDALLGIKLIIPTAYGDVHLKIPKQTESGDILKLNGMGLPETKNLPKGSMFVKVIIDYPKGERIKIYNKLKTLSLKDLPLFLKRYKNNGSFYPKIVEYQSIYNKLKQERLKTA